MVTQPPLRSNAEWLAALRGGDVSADHAVPDLERVLRSVVRRAGGARLGTHDVADLVQESLARVLAGLDRFRGDSAFTTWACGIAVRTTLTELRRRAVRARHDDVFAEAEAAGRELACPRTSSPDDVVRQKDLLAALSHAIGSVLTERQRTAILAELRGVPTVEIAARLDTNRNALYKLTHDARMRLRRALTQAGFGGDALAEERTP